MPPRPEATTVAGLPSGATDGTGTSDIGNGTGTGPAGAQPAPLVIDTNIVLDLLVFDDPAARALKVPPYEIVIDAACEAELERVLAYRLGKWSLDEAGRAACVVDRAPGDGALAGTTLRGPPVCATWARGVAVDGAFLAATVCFAAADGIQTTTVWPAVR